MTTQIAIDHTGHGPKYHKINAPYKRHTEGLNIGRFRDEYARDWVGYLADCQWEWQEKIDGTNIRITFDPNHWTDQNNWIMVGGRTDKAKLPADLLLNIHELFSPGDKEPLLELFPNGATLYGEGYGPGIQNGGGYRDDKSFILFDVKVNGWDTYAPHSLVREWAKALNLDMPSYVGQGTLAEAEEFIRSGFTSTHGDFTAEGIIIRPTIPNLMCGGERCILKIKDRDYR